MDLQRSSLQVFGENDPGEATSGDAVLLFREELLEHVLANNAAVYHSAERLALFTGDHVDEPTLAIAPIRGESSEIIGFLYGWRKQNESNSRFGVRELEAHFLRLVANAISTTLVRHQKEARISDQNTLLAQAFSQRVIEQLKVDPDLFVGREKVVTVLFADLRGYSAISNRLPARQTYAIVNEIMDLWTGYVIDSLGAVVDYFGDGLVAFWNAPLEVENHAAMAIRCAARVRESLPELTRKWGPVVGCRLDAGIGISTGLAHVGNCGSQHRIKYGPHGAVVNLAARLEKLTKGLGLPIVISEESALQSEADFLSRRICKAQVSGFEQPVDVYEPFLDEAKYSYSYLQEYEAVLHEVENSPAEIAEPLVVQLVASNPQDPAARVLLQRVRDEVSTQEGYVPGPSLLSSSNVNMPVS